MLVFWTAHAEIAFSLSPFPSLIVRVRDSRSVHGANANARGLVRHVLAAQAQNHIAAFEEALHLELLHGLLFGDLLHRLSLKARQLRFVREGHAVRGLEAEFLEDVLVHRVLIHQLVERVLLQRVRGAAHLRV